MSTKKRRFFSGNSLQAALVAAATEFDLVPEEINYRVVEKRHGFVKVRRNVVIEVDTDSPRRQPAESSRPAAAPRPERPPAAPPQPDPPPAVAAGPVEPAAPPAGEPSEAPEPKPERRPRPERDEEREVERPRVKAQGRMAEAMQEAVERLLDLVDLDIDAEIYEADKGFQVELAGPDEKRVVAEEGKVLRAIEHLAPRVLRGIAGEAVPCRADSGGFNERHADQLRALARRAASAVRRSGRSEVLDPMDPADRRIVHLALNDDSSVSTRSLGEGLFKRIEISPR